jgi:hypothetical protein
VGLRIRLTFEGTPTQSRGRGTQKGLPASGTQTTAITEPICYLLRRIDRGESSGRMPSLRTQNAIRWPS